MSEAEETKADETVEGAVGRLLACTFALYQKTHGFHWNVTGPSFYQLHKLFQEQYEELNDAADTIAEHLRGLGELAPQDFGDSGIKPGEPALAASAMIHDLLVGHAYVITEAQKVVSAAEAAGDEGTLNLAADRINAHRKHIWMLRVTIGV